MANHVFKRLLPKPANVRVARLLVRDSLAPMDDQEVAEVLTGELAANAVQHARTSFTVATAHDDDGMLTVEVHDEDHTLPVMALRDPKARRGRGLQLLNALAREWGITAFQDDGKTVWFRLAPSV